MLPNVPPTKAIQFYLALLLHSKYLPFIYYADKWELQCQSHQVTKKCLTLTSSCQGQKALTAAELFLSFSCNLFPPPRGHWVHSSLGLPVSRCGWVYFASLPPSAVWLPKILCSLCLPWRKRFSGEEGWTALQTIFLKNQWRHKYFNRVHVLPKTGDCFQIFVKTVYLGSALAKKFSQWKRRRGQKARVMEMR